MRIRPARVSDIAAIERLIERSVMRLMADDYTAEQRRASIGPLFGVDRRVIEDGAYHVAELDGRLLGSGGWSFRRTLFGGDAVSGRDDAEAQPGRDPANIRAYYTDPEAAKSGVATALLLRSEAEAAARGFTRMEMGATLSGRPFYLRHGYREGERFDFPLPGGVVFPLLHMHKDLSAPAG